MHTALVTLLDRLDSPRVEGTAVIDWGCPVPSFGDLSKARIATLGLNPSNREFVDGKGRELVGDCRRFHTLGSLGLSAWSEADARHLSLILERCRCYFQTNPYDQWFRVLDQVISRTGASYYSTAQRAAHLDVIPFATVHKWTQLDARERTTLFEAGRDTVGLLLRDSPVEALILNGRTVVTAFESIAGIQLSRRSMPSWSLARTSGRDVKGFAYWGVIDAVSGVTLRREILVLGFNHNVQSSFGVTTKVRNAIRDWVGLQVTRDL